MKKFKVTVLVTYIGTKGEIKFTNVIHAKSEKEVDKKATRVATILVGTRQANVDINIKRLS